MPKSRKSRKKVITALSVTNYKYHKNAGVYVVNYKRNGNNNKGYTVAKKIKEIPNKMNEKIKMKEYVEKDYRNQISTDVIVRLKK